MGLGLSRTDPFGAMVDSTQAFFVSPSKIVVYAVRRKETPNGYEPITHAPKFYPCHVAGAG